MRQAEKEHEGSFFQIMASLIFTAFALEAYLNHIGPKILKCWDDLERLSPSAKLNVLAEQLSITKDDSRRPFQTVKNLFNFRNEIAHGKTVTLQSEEQVSIASANLDDYTHKIIETRWEEYSTISNAQRARFDVEKIMNTFHDAVGDKDDTLFFGGIASSHTTLQP